MKDVFFTDSKYKIGILCACEKELKPYLAAMQNPVAEEYAMHIFYSGRIKERNIVAVYSGCGKINAAITAQQLIDQYDVDAIIFSGIAGGMKKDTGIFDTVVCTSSEFRDTNNEIYSDFPIMEKPVFYADDHLIEIAGSAAQQTGRFISVLQLREIFLQKISAPMRYVSIWKPRRRLMRVICPAFLLSQSALFRITARNRDRKRSIAISRKRRGGRIGLWKGCWLSCKRKMPAFEKTFVRCASIYLLPLALSCSSSFSF